MKRSAQSRSAQVGSPATAASRSGRRRWEGGVSGSSRHERGQPGSNPPRAGPQRAIRLRPPERRGLAYDKPLCAPMDGFTLHAATRAGASDAHGREALLRYVLRPPVAQDRLEQGQDGLVRILLRSPSPTGLSQSSWIRSRSCVVSPRAFLRHATTPSGMPASSQQRANGDRASCRHRMKRSHPSGPERGSAGADTVPGRSCSPALSAWTRSPAPPARGACGSSPSSGTQLPRLDR